MALENECKICKEFVFMYEYCCKCSSMFVEVLLAGDWVTQEEIDQIEIKVVEMIEQEIKRKQEKINKKNLDMTIQAGYYEANG